MTHIQTTNIASDYKRVKASKNTDRAYDCKVKEFLQYCDNLHGDDATPRLVTVEKFSFFFIIVLTGRRRQLN